MLTQKYIKALYILCNRLSEKEINWVLYGGTGLILRGINVLANDIDLLLDRKGALLINEVLKDFMITPMHFDKNSDWFESYIGEFSINGITVEPVSDLHRKIGDKKIALTDEVLVPEYIDVEGISVPVVSLENQLKVYRLCGREKDQIKIKTIEKKIASIIF